MISSVHAFTCVCGVASNPTAPTADLHEVHEGHRECVVCLIGKHVRAHGGDTETFPKNVCLMGKVWSLSSHLSPFIRARHAG